MPTGKLLVSGCGTVCGSPADLNLALFIIEELAPTRGLSLHHRKSLLFIPGEDSLPYKPLPPEIPITSEDFVLLGSPIGLASFCNFQVLKRIRNLKHTLSYLPDLQDSQMETTLLKSPVLPFEKYPFPSELALLPISETPLTPLTFSCLNPSLIWWVALYQTGLGPKPLSPPL